jgi:uncharacterized protein YmfQ (DUF2313 family)
MPMSIGNNLAQVEAAARLRLMDSLLEEARTYAVCGMPDRAKQILERYEEIKAEGLYPRKASGGG